VTTLLAPFLCFLPSAVLAQALACPALLALLYPHYAAYVEIFNITSKRGLAIMTRLLSEWREATEQE
jgi:hypothetical protein